MTSTLAQRAAEARWRHRRRVLIAQGQWQPFVDAGPVRERIRDIQDAGMPLKPLTLRLGLTPRSLDYLMFAGPGGEEQKVRRETAEAVMAYWPSLKDFPDTSRIDPTGTRRRVQAMMSRGWPQRAQAERAGVPERSYSRSLLACRVTAQFARKVAAVYDELWDKRPEDFGVEPSAAHWARAVARKRGMHCPLAWDDDTIDDPTAVPMLDAPSPAPTAAEENAVARWLMGESVVLDREGRREAIAYLMEWTKESPEEIAARLETTPDAVLQAWQRRKKKARQEGRRVPWRRELELARRTELSRREMETAA